MMKYTGILSDIFVQAYGVFGGGSQEGITWLEMDGMSCWQNYSTKLFKEVLVLYVDTSLKKLLEGKGCWGYVLHGSVSNSLWLRE